MLVDVLTNEFLPGGYNKTKDKKEKTHISSPSFLHGIWFPASHLQRNMHLHKHRFNFCPLERREEEGTLNRMAEVSGVIKRKRLPGACLFCKQLASERHPRNNRVSLFIYYACTCVFLGVDGRAKGTIGQMKQKPDWWDCWNWYFELRFPNIEVSFPSS